MELAHYNKLCGYPALSRGPSARWGGPVGAFEPIGALGLVGAVEPISAIGPVGASPAKISVPRFGWHSFGIPQTHA